MDFRQVRKATTPLLAAVDTVGESPDVKGTDQQVDGADDDIQYRAHGSQKQVDH